MEAKDTVINSKEIERCLDKWNDINNAAMAYGTDSPDIKDMVADFLQAQAEISFKAGIKEVVEFTQPLLEQIDKNIQGIRNNWEDPREKCRAIMRAVKQWQDKVKEWEVLGIDKEKGEQV